MAQNTASSVRHRIALWVLGFGFGTLLILASVAIWLSPTNVMNIVNIMVPLIASWIGTILAFYFGRENFEAANEHVLGMVKRLTPEERARSPVSTIMRQYSETVTLKLTSGQTEADVTLGDLRGKFKGPISRILVVDASDVAKYLIHDSSTDRYIADGKDETDSLQSFLDTEEVSGHRYDLGAGFVVVAEATTIKDAKTKMEAIETCQDIVVTANGKADEPVTGWVSNVRLSKYILAR